MADLSAEDQKLVTLARATRARIQAAQGAAVRDSDGRTYAATTVDLESLRLSAIESVIAMAVSSGSASVEACVVLGGPGEVTGRDAAVLGEFAGPGGLTVHWGDARGTIAGSRSLN